MVQQKLRNVLRARLACSLGVAHGFGMPVREVNLGQAAAPQESREFSRVRESVFTRSPGLLGDQPWSGHHAVDPRSMQRAA